MPCYTTIAIDLAANRYDPATLARILMALEFTVVESTSGLLFYRHQKDKVRAARGTYSREGGLELIAVDEQKGAKLIGEIRATYTREAVAASARRHGLKVETDAKDPTVLRLRTDGRTG